MEGDPAPIRIKPVAQGLRLLYYKEEWNYAQKTVKRKMTKATLEDIAAYGNLKDILAVLTLRLVLPLKFSKELTEKHVWRLLACVLGLYLLSGLVATSARHKGLDVDQTLESCFRKALATSINKAGIRKERAAGISSKNAQTPVFFSELVNWLKIRHGGRIGKVSRIDNNWRVTMPGLYAKYVFSWSSGKRVRVIPYPTKRYGSGFLIVGNVQDKEQHSRQRRMAAIETCLDALEVFTFGIAKDDVLRPKDLDRSIREDKDFTQVLPKVLAQYLEGLNASEIISLRRIRGNLLRRMNRDQ